MRVVDQQSFNELACNRCGVCCKSMKFGRMLPAVKKGLIGPIDLLRVVLDRDKPQSFDQNWIGQLIPTIHSDRQYSYECGHYRDNEDG